jgi:hypothetical protein
MIGFSILVATFFICGCLYDIHQDLKNINETLKNNGTIK